MLEDYSAKEYEYNDKKYTEYEVSQMQRSQERKIRETKRKLTGYNAGRKNTDDADLKAELSKRFEEESVRLKAQEKALKDFCKQTGRRVESARTQVHAILDSKGNIVGFNKSVSQKAVWAKRRYAVKQYQSNKGIERAGKDGIIKPKLAKGALTDKNDPLYRRRDAHANKYYAAMRNSRKKDIVDRIAKNTGISRKSIEKVYDHVLINEYELNGGKRKFDPDYYMAESFRRLREGKNIQKHDLIMLKHERLEYELMKKLHLKYEDAHKIAERKYNYRKALDEFIKENNL